MSLARLRLPVPSLSAQGPAILVDDQSNIFFTRLQWDDKTKGKAVGRGEEEEEEEEEEEAATARDRTDMQKKDPYNLYLNSKKDGVVLGARNPHKDGCGASVEAANGAERRRTTTPVLDVAPGLDQSSVPSCLDPVRDADVHLQYEILDGCWK
ncbi:hypothetical protein CORC01_08611 [Colletotrichum orchidophilum]|uniref:Uncharacterized protein n=1 Tax=Colletotrichum orchidophilum TaxID=1209926 RepID=A0A1G4B3V8_9PEZI|nr:uncharacterized protein CORC01_08611 [Colletotrichum orchidophilum]OHE96074.1 hypothetical protein CORC01_08611 [Colletotrichum orchidophilum]